MRTLIIAAALFACGLPAFAQEQSTPAPMAAPADEDTVRASRALAAIWRPLTDTSGDAAADFATACAGAQEELEQVDAAVPTEISAQSLSAVRAPHGLIIVPTPDEPRALFVFANAELSQMTSGFTALRVVDADQALLSLTGPAGQETLVQMGTAAGKAVMRILRPEAEPLLYVGCAASTG